jgi:hypothetical protein
MQKKTRFRPGDLIQIPFTNQMHTYARVLIDGSCAIYDYPQTEDIVDYSAVLASKILFIVKSNVRALKEGRWKIVDNIPLEENLLSFHPVYFNPSPFNNVDVQFYKHNKIAIEQAIEMDWIGSMSLNLAGIHDYIHVESRIKDYYEGKRNEFNRRTIDNFFKHANLMCILFLCFIY